MDYTTITEFLTYNDINIMQQLLVSGLVVLVLVQVFKNKIDRLVKFITKGKVKKVKTSDFTLVISFVQVIFVMFAINKYPLDFISTWLVVINTGLLYIGCTSGFDKIFKQIKIKQEVK